MHRPPRSMLQHSLIPFGCTETIVPNIGGTPPYLGLKSTNEKHRLFDLQTADASCLLFNVNMKLQHLKTMLNAFQGLSKLKNSRVFQICSGGCS